MISYYPELENIIQQSGFNSVDNLLDMLFKIKKYTYEIKYTNNKLCIKDIVKYHELWRVKYTDGFMFMMTENSNLIAIVYLDLNIKDFLKILKLKTFI